MAFVPPIRASPGRIRQFRGIGGPETQVLVVKGEEGRDYSDSVANVVQDFYLGEQGTLKLRRGYSKISRTGENSDIVGIFQATLSGVQQYGILYGGGVDLLSLGRLLDYAPIKIPPLPPIPTDWPTGWPKPSDVKMEYPTTDPLFPPEEQACANSYTITSFPPTMTFTMPYGGPAPAIQRWYWMISGFMANSIIGSYNADTSSYTSDEVGYWYWFLGPCNGRLVKGVDIAVTGKDSAGNWLAPGTYTYQKSLSFSDGNLISVDITLMVAVPAITLAPSSFSAQCVTGDAGNKTTTIRITNSGDAGSTLNWTAGFTGDIALTAILGLSATSGALAQGAYSDLTLTITNPGSLSAGSYSALATFSGGAGVTSKTVTITLTVAPLYTNSIHVHWHSYHDTSPNPALNRTGDFVVASSAHPTASPFYDEPISAGERIQVYRNFGIWYVVWAYTGSGASTQTGLTFDPVTGYPSCDVTLNLGVDPEYHMRIQILPLP